jgi:hypothetical protein
MQGSDREWIQFGRPDELGVAYELSRSWNLEHNPWGRYRAQESGLIDVSDKRIAQVGIVVADVEATAKRYWELLGFGPWYLFDFKPPSGRLDVFRGVRAEPDAPTWIRAAIAEHPSLQFELLQAMEGPGTHMDFWREWGPGAHHLSFDVIEDYDQVVQSFLDLGIEMEMSGTAGEAYAYCYLATLDQLSTIFEVVKLIPDKALDDGMYGTIPAKAVPSC